MKKEEKIELLLREVEILANKTEHALDRQWRIRSFGFSLWIACNAVGLGQFSDGTPNLSFLIAAFAIPVAFFAIDSRHHLWFRILTLRDREISKYINEDNYEHLTEPGSIGFPIYDPHGKFTFGDHNEFLRQANIWHIFRRPTPLIFYGIQIFGSGLLCMLYFY